MIRPLARLWPLRALSGAVRSPEERALLHYAAALRMVYERPAPDGTDSIRRVAKSQEGAGLEAPYAQGRAERDGTDARASRLEQGGGRPRVKSSVPDCPSDHDDLYEEHGGEA